MLAKSLTGEELARELISVLSVTYSIVPTLVVAAMRDRSSVNNVAIRTLKVVYPNLIDVGCFSHTLDHVGEHFHTPVLSDFTSAWISLFSHSPNMRLLWREQTGRSMGSYSSTRWWSRYEVMDQILVQFGDVERFVLRKIIGSNATSTKLASIINDPQKKALLKIELSAIVDWGKPFVKATYSLEGDGELALECYDIIEVRAAIIAAYTPNVQAVVREMGAGNVSVEEQLLKYAHSCVQPGIDYFEKQLSTSLKDSLSVFQSAWYFSPQKLRILQPDAEAINNLSVFPVLTDVIEKLKEELPAYLAKVSDMASATNISGIEWWKAMNDTLPQWASAARKVLLVQPSSAAAERAFSLLNSSFGSQQHHSLCDYVETSIMLQYNCR